MSHSLTFNVGASGLTLPDLNLVWYYDGVETAAPPVTLTEIAGSYTLTGVPGAEVGHWWDVTGLADGQLFRQRLPSQSAIPDFLVIALRTAGVTLTDIAAQLSLEGAVQSLSGISLTATPSLDGLVSGLPAPPAGKRYSFAWTWAGVRHSYDYPEIIAEPASTSLVTGTLTASLIQASGDRITALGHLMAASAEVEAALRSAGYSLPSRSTVNAGTLAWLDNLATGIASRAASQALRGSSSKATKDADTARETLARIADGELAVNLPRQRLPLAVDIYGVA